MLKLTKHLENRKVCDSQNLPLKLRTIRLNNLDFFPPSIIYNGKFFLGKFQTSMKKSNQPHIMKLKNLNKEQKISSKA